MASETDAETLPTFDTLPLSAEVRRAVDELGYVHPTPVQRAVYEPALRGRDLVVQARTGTGKTAAFGLPLIDGLVRRKDPVVQALALCPTRELALQVTRELDALSKHRGTRVVAIYGGAPMPKQIAQIKEGAQIIAGTPGRVLDHLSRGTLDPKNIRVVVLDESDEMLSMGFLPQINEIFSFLPASRQTLLFSATLPADIRRMAETRLTNPEFITLSGDQVGALEIQHFVYLSRGDKLNELVQIIEVENPESAIVFCNTRDETKRVAAALNQQGYAADWLNADLPQSDREKVMAATREGRLRFLVCTDVASRGIDISHLTHVINHDFPESAESYVHRTGRTGRAGRTGTAIALIEPSDIGNLYLLRLTYKLRPIERQLPSANERKTRAESDLVRWFVDGLGARKPHPDDLALARRLLTHEQAEVVIANLLRDHLGARPDALEDAAAARRARPPRAPETKLDEKAAPANKGASSGAAGPVAAEMRPRAPAAEVARPAAASTAAAAVKGAPSSSTEVAPSATTSPEATPAPAPSRVVAPVVAAVGNADAVSRPRAVRLPRPVHAAEEAVEPPSNNAAPARVREASPDLPPPPRPQALDRTTRTSLAVKSTAEGVGTLARAMPDRDSGTADPVEADPNVVEIYASAGRRQGAKPSDYERLLDASGVPPEAVVYVRVRHRNAFVAVRREELARVLQVLNGATIAGRSVRAEPARADVEEETSSLEGAEDV